MASHKSPRDYFFGWILQWFSHRGVVSLPLHTKLYGVVSFCSVIYHVLVQPVRSFPVVLLEIFQSYYNVSFVFAFVSGTNAHPINSHSATRPVYQIGVPILVVERVLR